MTTLEKVVRLLNNFQQDHLNIKEFKFGELSDREANKMRNYCYMHVMPESNSISTNVLTLNLRVDIMDRLMKDQQNLEVVLSDTLTIMHDLIAYIRFTNKDNKLQITETISPAPFIGALDSEVAGWFATFSFKLENPLCLKSIPLLSQVDGGGVAPNDYATVYLSDGSTVLVRLMPNDFYTLAETIVTDGGVDHILNPGDTFTCSGGGFIKPKVFQSDGTTLIIELNSGQIYNLQQATADDNGNITTINPGDNFICTPVSQLSTSLLNSQLTNAQIIALNSAIIQQLTNSQINNLTTSQVNFLSEGQIQSLNNANVNKLSTIQIGQISGSLLNMGLVESQIQGLSNALVQMLTASQVQALTSGQVVNLTSAQIEALTNVQLSFLNVAQRNYITTLLNVTQIALLSNSQVGLITAPQLNAGVTQTNRQRVNKIYPLFGGSGTNMGSRLANFTTLLENNDFGNTTRFTDLSGGTTFANNYMIDHATGLAWYLVRQANATQASAITTASGFSITISGTNYTGWRLPSVKEIMDIANFGSNPLLSYAPFSESGATLTLWTRTDDQANGANAHIFHNSQVFTQASKTGSRAFYMVRTHY